MSWGRTAIVTAVTIVACTRGEREVAGHATTTSTAPSTVLAAASSSAASSRPFASAPEPPPAPAADSSDPVEPAASPAVLPLIENRGGLSGLLAAVTDVEQIELVRWDTAPQPRPLPPGARETLKRLIGRGHIINARTVAHPPWPAALLLRTRKHGAYAVTLVGSQNLRLDPGNASGKFTGTAARWNDSPAPEMELADDEGWLWSYLEAQLGPTSQKEYQTPPRPSYPIRLRD